ncbi:hypothetical protein GQ43DRAFT_168942 [Delitschia confertaspora ATCC 74209]|uniref:Uncharacterized protein n=1 Tax=Delitschia confertaspora ATCC 74209 TaxID=1513339 RepID=A0A9P4MMG1_9PLEO|nr:hypothetical protein GQ43DRAFT_168942 [Delitschia confertaspora ATCC 74209]
MVIQCQTFKNGRQGILVVLGLVVGCDWRRAAHQSPKRIGGIEGVVRSCRLGRVVISYLHFTQHQTYLHFYSAFPRLQSWSTAFWCSSFANSARLSFTSNLTGKLSCDHGVRCFLLC